MMLLYTDNLVFTTALTSQNCPQGAVAGGQEVGHGC